MVVFPPRGGVKLNNKLSLRAAALLCTMAISSLSVYSADEIKDFNALKEAIENGEQEVNVQGDIEFESSLTVSGTKEVSGKNSASESESKTFSFSPKPSTDPAAKDPYVAPAFSVNSGGNLTLKDITINGFGDETQRQIIDNNGSLTIGPGVKFTNNKVKGTPAGGRPYPGLGGIIYNNKDANLTIQTDGSGNVEFQKVENSSNNNPDILLYYSSLNITGDEGTVTFGNGIASYDSNASITHNAKNSVVLSGNNGQYTGTYTNSDGSLTFDKDGNTFFGGQSEFTGGELKWENNKENVFVNNSSLTLKDNANLTVGNGTDEAKLTTADNVSIEGAKTITIKKQGELALGKSTTTFDATTNGTNIKGSGKLSISGKKLSLIGQVIDDEGQDLQFSSTNATVNIESVSNGAKELNVIAGSNADNTNLILNLKDYVSGEADVDITVDGTAIKELNFVQDSTNNNYNGDITIKGKGVVTNGIAANTTVQGKVTIENTDSGIDYSLVNKGNATLTISGELENNGKIDNRGTLNLNASVNTNDSNGEITNTGSIVVSEGFLNKNKFTSTNNGSFSAKSLNNESGTFDMSQSSGTFTVTNNVQNSSGTIKGQSATFGSYNDSTGEGTNLTLNGTLTITGDEILSNVIENAGTIEAAVINVTAGGVTNSGTITAKTGDITLTNGDITNNAEAQITSTKGNISAKNIANSGTIESGNNITAAGTVNNSGSITASNEISATGAVDNQTADSSITGTNLTFSSTLENSGTVTATETTTVKGKLTNKEKASLTTKGGELNEVANDGTITNESGTLKLAGEFSGKGTLEQKGGELNVNASASNFEGTFTQTAGTTNVGNSSNIFGGEKNVNGGVFNVNSGAINYTGVVLGSNAQFNHKGQGGTIDNSVLTFSGSDAQAVFGVLGSVNDFVLDSGIKGSKDNIITFNSANLELTGENKEYDYKSFNFNNSALKLGKSVGDSIDSYTLNNFHSSNSSVDLNLEIKNDSGRYLDSDKLTFKGNSWGNLRLGNVYIKGDRNVENGYDFNTKEDIIKNEGSSSSVKFDKTKPSGDKVHIGSNSFTYDLDIQDKTVNLKVTGYADENTLYDVNKQTDTRRFFIDDTVNGGVYNIGKSLDTDSVSTGKGDFSIYGSHDGQETNTRKSVLSGALKDGGNGSLFKIDDETEVNLNVSNLTIKEAQSTDRGGSVLSNKSDNAKIVMDNLLITENSAEADNGGAIYNNGGQKDVASGAFTAGLWIKDSEFSGNQALGDGGAIYNDTKGYLILDGVITKAASGDAKNDIYNKGFTLTQGENTFNSLYTNDEGGRSFFTGKNTFSELVNNSDTAYLPDPNEEYSMAFYGENTVTNSFENSGSAINHSESLTFSENSTIDNSGTFNNSGVLEFNGEGLTNTGTFDNEEYLYISKNSSVKGETGNINNSGVIDLEGDASLYTGNFTQKDDNEAITEVTGTFFGGTSKVESGSLNWFNQNDLAEGAKLNVSGTGTVLNVGDNDANAGKITFRSGSTIADGVITNVFKNGILNVDGGDVALSGDGAWLGKVELSDGKLTLNGTNNKYQEGTGILVAKDGELNLDGLTVLHLGNGSSVERNVKTNIGKDSTVLLEQGEFTLDNGADSSDTWEGTIVLDENSKGTLTFSGYDSSTGMGTLLADGGSINIVKDEVTGIGSNITFEGKDGETSGIGKNVKTNIDADSFVTLLEGGYLALNDDEENTSDIWQGQVNLQGGTFDYGMKNAQDIGTLKADSGNLNLLSDSVLNIEKTSSVADKVAVDIQQGATVDIKEEGAEFNIDSATNDKWNGLVKNEGGNFNVSGMDNTKGNGGGIQQTKGTTTLTDESNIYISDSDSFITGGDVVLEGKSKLSFTAAGIQDLNVDNLTMNDNTQLGILNGEINSAHAQKVTVDGTANFTVDLNARNKTGDEFDFGSISGNGTLNVSDFDFTGGAPIDRYIDFTLFTGDKSGVEFDATKDLKFTPIGYYGLESLGEGNYRAFLDHYNPQVFRGQVATIAMYTSQLLVDDIVTNHFILHNDRLLDNAKLANKYAAASALFAPYQKTYKEGGLWSKSYVSFDKMDLTHGLSVKNNIYGMLLGADLPAVELKNDWEFIPTGYVGYNGGHQHFDGVSMYQNGGQLGVMGTFIKDNFIGSVTAYGGGYMNDMDVAGFNDTTGNWFAGTAAKAAYNYELFKDFTVQPNLFIAYNAFGKQNWGTDFGVMSMNSGMLNGINIAPGLNLILQKDTWSLYTTVSYMYFANDKVDGYAGNVHLPNVRMDHGYLQYGIGGTKVWNDRLAAYGQVNVRNAGINGIGFQAGINYLFDLNDTVANVKNGTKAAGRGIAKGAKATGDGIVTASKATGNAIATGAKATGDGIVTASKATGNAIATGAKATGDAVEKGAKATGRGISNAVNTISDGTHNTYTKFIRLFKKK